MSCVGDCEHRPHRHQHVYSNFLCNACLERLPRSRRVSKKGNSYPYITNRFCWLELHCGLVSHLQRNLPTCITNTIQHVHWFWLQQCWHMLQWEFSTQTLSAWIGCPWSTRINWAIRSGWKFRALLCLLLSPSLWFLPLHLKVCDRHTKRVSHTILPIDIEQRSPTQPKLCCFL